MMLQYILEMQIIEQFIIFVTMFQDASKYMMIFLGVKSVAVLQLADY